MGTGWREGERRKKGEQEDWGKFGEVGWLRWRKSGYGSRKEDILINGAIFGLAGVQRDVPS